MSSNKFICIRKCYYEGKLWEVGEILPDELAPNKHFTLDGQIQAGEKRVAYGPGDDPRSTKQIIADLKKHFGIALDAKTVRKTAWIEWRNAEEAAGKKGLVTERPATQNQEPKYGKADDPGRFGLPTFDNSILNKNFSDWSPDEIDKTTAKEICQKLNAPPYSLDMKPIGITKADLIKRGIEVEEQQIINAQG